MPAKAKGTSDSYHGLRNGRLVRLRSTSAAPDERTELVHSRFRSMMLAESYTCVGGASAVRRGLYRIGLFPPLGSVEAVRECLQDLRLFIADFPVADEPVGVFVAVFDGPQCACDAAFENLLWRHLQGIHCADTQPAWWSVEEPPGYDDEIGFLIDGRNFFVVGLHPGASRWSRRFAWPTLVFNSLSHVDPLRAAGQFDRMRDRIRARDVRLQGSPNPTLPLVQVAQFSGRPVGPDWRCPLHPRED